MDEKRKKELAKAAKTLFDGQRVNIGYKDIKGKVFVSVMDEFTLTFDRKPTGSYECTHMDIG